MIFFKNIYLSQHNGILFQNTYIVSENIDVLSQNN